MISLRMNVSVLIAAVTEAPLIGVLLTTDITHLVTKKKKKKKSHWLAMAPWSSVQLIDKRRDVMSCQIVWKC